LDVLQHKNPQETVQHDRPKENHLDFVFWETLVFKAGDGEKKGPFGHHMAILPGWKVAD
jgi:cysteinyl-tRNA synthetase